MRSLHSCQRAQRPRKTEKINQTCETAKLLLLIWELHTHTHTLAATVNLDYIRPANGKPSSNSRGNHVTWF